MNVRLWQSWFFRFALGAIALSAVAACSGGTAPTPLTFTPAPVATATPTAAPTATPTPVTPSAIQTSVPLAIVSGASVSTPLPAPTGYSSKVTIPIVSAASSTTFQFVSSLTLPTALPVLQSASRVPATVRIPQAAGNLVPIFFDSIVPSQPVTVAGKISVAQAFPAGVLGSTTQYYLGFYDSSQPSPAWQTIAGPVTSTDGLTLTFSGTAGSFTFEAGQLYGFAIFSLSASTATPPPAPQTLAYIPNQSKGIAIVNASGVGTTLAINVEDIGLDDSGNIYALALAPTPSPAPSPVGSASPAPTPTPGPPTISLYAAGSTTPKTTYKPSNPYGAFITSAGTGAFAVFGGSGNGSGVGGLQSLVTDVWDPGAGSAPSRTITEPFNGVYFGLMAHDGTLYLPHANTNGTFQYDVYAPGSSAVTRTISETVVPAAQQANFNPNYAAIGPDGTLYVTEYSFYTNDPLAGLYIYPPNGTEKFVATTSDANGAGPEGVDVDAAGNVYVVNNNGSYNLATNSFHDDSLHDIEVFGPGGVGGPNGAASPKHITGSFDGYPLAVSADGKIFLSSFGFVGRTGVLGSFAIPAGGSTVTQIASFGGTTILLYDGNRETTGLRRTASVSSASSGHSFGGPLARWAAMQRRISGLAR